MAEESVVYVHSISCTSCGFRGSGYLRTTGDGRGDASCPKCGFRIVQELPPHHVVQIPPVNPIDHAHHTYYPGLYTMPKYEPKLDLVSFLRLTYAPRRAATALYLTTNLSRAMALVIQFSILGTLVSLFVTANMADVIDYDASDALLLGAKGFLAWVLSLLSFLIFGVVAASIAKGIFGGRGERVMSLTLTGYCYPWLVFVSIVILLVFNAGFSGLDLSNSEHWSQAELDQAIVGAVALMATLIAGFGWVLWMTSRALGVANDISMGESMLTAVFSATLAGLVYYVFSELFQLPLGVSF